MELDNKKNKKQEFEGGPFILPEVEVTGEIMPFEFGGVEDWKANIEKYIQQDNKISKQKKAEYLDALSRIDDSQRTLKNFVLWMSSPNTIGPWEGFLTSTKRYHGYFPSDNPIYKPQGEKVWKPPIDPNDNWEYSSEPITTNHPPKEYTEIPTIYEILDKDIKQRKDIEKAMEKAKEWINNQKDSIAPDGWQYAKYAKGGLIKKHYGGGWISWLGQEGVPTLRSLRRYGSYSNPVQLPELVVTAPVPPPVFDRRVRTYPGGHEVISDIIFDYYRNYDGTPSGYYMGDNSPIRGGRLIFTSPRGNDTIWTEPTPTTEDLKAWEEYYGPKQYTGWMDSQYVKPAKDQKKAKQTFYKNVKGSKPSNREYKEEVNALQRAKKGN